MAEIKPDVTSAGAKDKLRDMLAEVNSKDEEAVTEELESVTAELEESSKPEVGKGECCFYSQYPHLPVNTALASGKKVVLPYTTSDAAEIKELEELVKVIPHILVVRG